MQIKTLVASQLGCASGHLLKNQRRAEQFLHGPNVVGQAGGHSGSTLLIAPCKTGHVDGSTTLRYAQPVDAETRRRRAKLRFGSE